MSPDLSCWPRLFLFPHAPLVDGGEHAGPLRKGTFTQEPAWAVTSINLDLAALPARATRIGESV